MKIAVAGILGRVGRLIAEEALNQKHITLVAGTYRTAVKIPEGIFDKIPTLTDKIEDAVMNAQALIDFSHHSAFQSNLKACLQKGIAYIGGLTGLSLNCKNFMQDASQSIPIFYAPNMSEGIAVLNYLVAQAALLLPNSDIEICELHHKNKKDAPSGTALTLSEHAARARHWNKDEVIRTSRAHNEQDRPEKEIGVMSLRGGGALGEHRVLLCGEEEILTLSHQTLDRRQYAKGALKAAAWLINQPPGLYNMADLLGLKKTYLI